METKLFSWNFDKLHLVVSHLADQQRYNCAFSGQNREGAYEIDLEFYHSDPAFANLPVTRRHLHGKEGIYSRIYGHVEALRSQLQQFDRETAIQALNFKTLGLAMSRSSAPKNMKDEIFDSLISISKQQLEETDDIRRMTRSELAIHNTKGTNRHLFAKIFDVKTDALPYNAIQLKLRERRKPKTAPY